MSGETTKRPVDGDRGAVGVGVGGDEVEMQHRAEVLEHRLTAAERGRAGDEAVLVDQTGAGQRLGEGVATERR